MRIMNLNNINKIDNLKSSSFWEQYKALIVRNFLIKKKQRSKTLSEVLLPLYFIFILALVRLGIKNVIYDPIQFPHDGASLQWQWNPLLSHFILVTPDNLMVRNIIEQAADKSEIKYFRTQSELLQFYRENAENVTVAVEFEENILQNASYVIRINQNNTDLVSPYQLFTPGENCRSVQPNGSLQNYFCPPNSYFHSGFLSLQSSIDLAIIKQKTNVSLSNSKIFFESFPLNSYTSDSQSYILRGIVPLYMVFAWAQFILYMMILVVFEKEKKIKEAMLMMGLKHLVYWLAWFTIYASYVIILAIVCVVFLPLASVISKVNLFLLFILFVLYGMSSILLGFMLTPFFSNAKTAGVVGQLLQVAMSLLFYLQVFLSDKISTGTFWALGLLSPCAFSLAIDKTIYFDFTNEGLNMSNIWEGDGLPFAGSLIMIVFDCFLYLFLAWYLDAVLPSEFGIRRKPWFIFQVSFWKNENKIQENQQNSRDSDSANYRNLGSGNRPFTPIDDNPNVEKFPSQLAGKEAIRIRNLHKIFKKSPDKQSQAKTLHALDGVSMDIYSNQITAILGHNGAGKSTLLNILTSLTPFDIGKVEVLNNNIKEYSGRAAVRKRTGVCPQHDILFDFLTAREHLYFYAKIKGVKSDLIKYEVEEMIHDIDLVLKADCNATKLSGGQKRKLSIGIALIGDPPLIFLDEPTAGVDAYSRRKLWALLTKKKQGKVILLTTHFMDEADILADRKAILSHGKIRCYGTSMFLKNRFGLGYHLILIVREGVSTQDVTSFVEKFVDNLKLARHSGNEISFLIPATSSSRFPQLFEALDEKSAENELIMSYGVTMTTLEEVFLALSDENVQNPSDELTSDQVISRRSSLRSASLDLRLRSKSVDSMSNNNTAGTPRSNDLQEITEESILEHYETPNVIDGKNYTLDEKTNAIGGKNDANNETTNVVGEGNGTAYNPSESFKFEDVEVKKSKWRTFKALFKLRFLNVIREPSATFFLIVFPLVFVSLSMYLGSILGPTQTPLDSPLLLGTEIYMLQNDYTTNCLLYNGTGRPITYFERALEKSNIEFSMYNSSYEFIAKNQPHFCAIHVNDDFSDGKSEEMDVRIRYNVTYSHILPILVNIVDNAILELINDESETFNESNSNFLRTFNQRLPLTTVARQNFNFAAFMNPMLLGIVFTLIPAGLAIEFVYDREINGRSALRLNGVSFNSYFGSFFTVITSLYMLIYVGLVVLVKIFEVPSLVIPAAYACLALLYWFYVPSAVLSSAFCSYIFDKRDTAMEFYPPLAQAVGIILYTVVSMVDIFVPEGSYASYIHYIATIFIPFYIPYGGLYYIIRVYTFNLHRINDLGVEDYLTPEIIVMFVMEFVHIPIYYVLLRIVDTVKQGGNVREALWLQTRRRPGSALVHRNIDSQFEDKDVKNERERIKNNLRADNSLVSPIVVYDLSKNYKKDGRRKKGESKLFRAVNSISLEVKSGEIFGLLGPNGAGKTSALKIITAEEKATTGSIFLNGKQVESNLSNAFEGLGYCAQEDSLWRNITVAEHIECFANINGIDESKLHRLIDEYVNGLNIAEHRNKKSKHCSGGTKRKLSYILSMIGKARVVLMDEPSTGMDPQSKRFLWNSILANFRGERCAVLTTHSMEEADALSSKIGIMVKGEFRCFGSVQHLKNTYGGGYSLELKVRKDPVSHGNADQTVGTTRPTKREVETVGTTRPTKREVGVVSPTNSIFTEVAPTVANEVKAAIMNEFSGAFVKEEFDQRIVFHIPRENISSLAAVFRSMETLKNEKKIEEYALSQTTLEQVFLRFARLQDIEDETDDSSHGRDNIAFV